MCIPFFRFILFVSSLLFFLGRGGGGGLSFGEGGVFLV